VRPPDGIDWGYVAFGLAALVIALFLAPHIPLSWKLMP
jgi:hypothetical protein